MESIEDDSNTKKKTKKIKEGQCRNKKVQRSTVA